MEIAMEGDSVQPARLGYRPNVALILEDGAGKVLIGERRDIVGAWQFPQGGVRKGESHQEALLREVEEEVLLSPYCYEIQESKGPYRYQFSKGFEKYPAIGQEQYYYRALFLGDKSQMKMEDTSPEFRALRWIAPSEFQLTWLPPMKQPVYAEIFHDFFHLNIS